MRVSEVQAALRQRISVTRHDVTVAKAYIVSNFQSSTVRLLDDWLKKQGVQLSETVSWDESGDPEPQLQQLANYCRWRLAAFQAVWELMGEGVLLSASGEDSLRTTIGYQTPKQGGGWRFTEDRLIVPASVALAPTLTYRAEEPLVVEQLYLAELHASDLEPDVSDALGDAVRCFRHELYLPCLAMLSSATERAWIHTGLALTHFARGRSGFSPSTLDGLDAGFRSPAQSVSVTYDKVLRIYDRVDVFGDVHKLSGCRPDGLGHVHIWSNVVRDGRNALHYDARPTLENSYTKTAVLLIAAADHHQTLYTIRSAARQLAADLAQPG